jgi:hypothetical protein
MSEAQDPRRAEKIARRYNIIGLVLMALGTLAFLLVLAVAIGIGHATELTASALGFYVGWRWATRDSGPGSPGTPGPGTVVDTEDPDPGQFIPRGPVDPPGTFTPPPPSRDSSRDFEWDQSRDSR